MPGKRTLVEAIAPSGGGRPLEPGIRTPMERSFGADFSSVRVHEGSDVGAVSASAYARGEDLHFAPGAYDPGSQGGRELIGHELAHVVQQREGRAAGAQGHRARNDDAGAEAIDDAALEAEADRHGATAARGERVPGAGRGAPAMLAHGAVVQGHRFRLGRGDDPDRAKKAAAIAAQNAQLRSVTRLFVDESADPPGHAYAVPTGAGAVEVTLSAPPIYPDDHTFGDSLEASFHSEHWTYTVQLITAPDLVPSWTAAQDVVVAVARQRVDPPYTITKVAKRGGGTAMGRPVAGRQAWDVNPSFDMVGPGYRRFESRHEVIAWLVSSLGMQTQDHIEFVGRAGMVALPAPSTQPYVIYLHKDTPRIDQPSDARSEMSVGEFEQRFERAEFAGERVADQTRISAAPSIKRKDGGSERDPGTVMGAPAWATVGGNAPPVPGALASHEWCHLIGDGDGGTCAPENLIVGTNSVNTEQLAMENALRNYRAVLWREWRLSIQIQARALCRETLYQGKTYLVAEQICYDIDIVRVKNGVRREILRRVMDGTRGAITKLEYDALGAMLEEQLDLAIRDFVLHGLPAGLMTPASGNAGPGASPMQTSRDDPPDAKGADHGVGKMEED